MRWNALFADLESAAEADARQQLTASVREMTRAERATVTLAERLDAHRGRRLSLRIAADTVLCGTLVDVGPHWALLDEGATQTLVPTAALVAVAGLGRGAGRPPGEVARRLDLRHALRTLARNRSYVRVWSDGVQLAGTIDRVGADHLDLAVHEAGQWRRCAEVDGVWSLPFGHLRCVRSGG